MEPTRSSHTLYYGNTKIGELQQWERQMLLNALAGTPDPVIVAIKEAARALQGEADARRPPRRTAGARDLPSEVLGSHLWDHQLLLPALDAGYCGHPWPFLGTLGDMAHTPLALREPRRQRGPRRGSGMCGTMEGLLNVFLPIIQDLKQGDKPITQELVASKMHRHQSQISRWLGPFNLCLNDLINLA